MGVALALAVGATSCGQIDEIRDVFDTVPVEDEGGDLASGTTLPIVPLGTRLPMPPTRVLDEYVVYTLDPDLAPPTTTESRTGGVGLQRRSPDTAAPIPTDAAPSVSDDALAAGPLTHIRVHLALDANVREIEAVRDALSSYVPEGAVVAEFTGEDVVAVLRALYDDDPRFVEALGSRDAATILLLSHRWPEESALRTGVVRTVQRLSGVDDVVSTWTDRIHRATLTVDAPSQLVASFRIGAAGSSGFFVREGQRITFLDRAGVVRGVSIAAADHTLTDRIVLDPNDAGTAATVIPGPPTRPLGQTCRTSDSRGLLEVRVCRYSAEATGIEVRTGGGAWNPLVGAPEIPRVWRDETPTGASALDAEWTTALLSPDGARVLAQWGGTCLTEAAAIIDITTAAITFLETATRRPWGPGSRALGWTPDGRAVVYLGHDECGQAAPVAGLFLVDAEGTLEEVLANGTGDGIPVLAGTWAHIDP